MRASKSIYLFFSLFVAITSVSLLAQQTNNSSATSGVPASTILKVFSNLPVFKVNSFGASGSASTGTCSGVAGTLTLKCSFATNDFAVGQGIHIVGGGAASADAAVPSQPVITRSGSGSGSHTYCYVVDTADPLEGTSAPSPQTCIGNEPALSFAGVWNYLTVNNSTIGPSPAYLWYVSEDGGPWQLVTVAGFVANAMDVGERPGTRGGWPNNLPASNPDIAKNEDLYTTVAAVVGNTIVITNALPSSFASAAAMHDDTQAVESAMLAASAAGGGTVQFGTGTYHLDQPAFIVNGSDAAPIFTNNLLAEAWYGGYSSLYLPSNSTGKVNIQGQGSSTVILTPADHGGVSSLFQIGQRTRPDDLTGVLKMQSVAKGATSITLTSGTGGLTAGSDVFLYSGSFGSSPCLDTNGTANECHFSELNTVASISGNTVNLVYPTSKRFYNDGSSSFGAVKMPTVPHDIAIQSLTIDTTNPILTTGLVYGMVINSLQVNGYLHRGAFGGGFKRDVTIENSNWGFGIGDASWGGTSEYDQFTNVAFLNNTISGYRAPASEGESLMPRIYGTEGSSGFTFQNNTFNNVSVYMDQTTDDTISNNVFNDGIIKLGNAYNDQASGYGPADDVTYDSFGSQVNAQVENNTFNEDSTFVPPFLMEIGHFDSATISGNNAVFNGSESIGAITAYSGTLTGNTLTLPAAGAAIGFTLMPDESPTTAAAPLSVTSNSVSTSGPSVGVYVPDLGFTDSSGICVQNNKYSGAGMATMITNPSHTPQICGQ